jgi:UDP-N-acetylmuramoylalanine--D-glutamate ligase
MRPVDARGRHDDWSGVRATVAGFGVSGFAAADNLTHLGASVVALDESAEGRDKQEKAELLRILGADVRLGEGTTTRLPPDTDLLVVSPGWKPSAPLVAQARERGIPVWGEVELAWRLRDVGPTAGRLHGWRSPAPTARPRPSRCSTRSCGRRACGAWRPATSGYRWSRR